MGAGVEAAAQLRPRPSITVVLTDGFTPWPDDPPRGMRVVVGLLGDDAPDAPDWALSGTGARVVAGRPLPVLGGLAGLAGPVAFTAAWAASSLLQTGYAATQVQISGLAAPDARDPWIMITGFLVLGCCSAVFGTALHRELGGSGREGWAGREEWAARANLGRGPIQAAGLLTVAAGLLRRDRMLLTAPAHESWHNHAHDVVSAMIYVALIARPAAAGPQVPRRPVVGRAALAAGGRQPGGRRRSVRRVLHRRVPGLGGPAAADRRQRAARGRVRGRGAAARRRERAAAGPRVTCRLSWRHARSQGDR